MERWSVLELQIAMTWSVALGFGGWWLVKKMDVRGIGRYYLMAWSVAFFGVVLMAQAVFVPIMFGIELFSRL